MAAARERGEDSGEERDANRDDDAPTVASMMDAMKAVLNRQFKELGVEILEVIIRDITLPDAVQSQMTHRTMIICDNNIERMQRKVAVQSMLHEEEIRLKGAYESDRAKLIAEGEYDATVARLGLDTLRAEGERDVRTIETQMHIDVGLVKAENDLTVQRIVDETRLETERIRVQSESDAEAMLAEAKNEVDAISAKGDLEVAKNVAKGEKGACVSRVWKSFSSSPGSHSFRLPAITIAMFKAEGISAPLNRKLNDHVSKLHLLKAQSELAKNGGVRSRVCYVFSPCECSLLTPYY